MDVEIRGIGAFDVVIKDVSEQDALKAIGAANTPKVRAAFQVALDRAKALADEQGRFTFVEGNLGVEVWGSHKLKCILRRYNKPRGGTFWQGYLREAKLNIRRATLDEAKAAVVAMLVEYEDNLTRADQ